MSKDIREKKLASIMEKVARKSVQLSANNRCMYIVHQPMMPERAKMFKKKFSKE